LGGEIGLVLGAILDDEQLDLRAVTTSGTNGCYVEDRRGGDLECLAEMPASTLNRHESDNLCNQMLTCGLDTGVAVLTGPAGAAVVDPDVYRRVASDLTSMGVRVLADLSREPLDAALEGGISVLKISDDEVDGPDPVKAARKLRESVADLVVLTRGSAPSLALDNDERFVHVPPLETVNHRGAGDSMTAGMAAGLARGLSQDDAIRLGAAAGAVNVTRHGLASGRKDTIEKIAEQIEIKPVTKEELRDARTGHQ
jgi:1-phosphofructokinase